MDFYINETSLKVVLGPGLREGWSFPETSPGKWVSSSIFSSLFPEDWKHGLSGEMNSLDSQIQIFSSASRHIIAIIISATGCCISVRQQIFKPEPFSSRCEYGPSFSEAPSLAFNVSPWASYLVHPKNTLERGQCLPRQLGLFSLSECWSNGLPWVSLALANVQGIYY